MKAIKNELQKIVREQRKTNRKLDLWTYRIMFFWGVLSAVISMNKTGKILGYTSAALAAILQILTYVEDIMDIVSEPDEEEELFKEED